ncbi:zymogen granule protein 16 homolog B [Heterocephalus glaber]|uniref:Zymogen granule protein 16 homolog B n=1 Tax=Heterocephalus glaber TaxID=10181 RepID=A0AAX6RU37_HETGA|nr:zymogen granule protein 16 homolog B [Heterocephalus glaber]
MLLFLTVALLFSLPCSAQEIQGPGFGSYFYIKGEELGEIQGIRVFVGILGLIKGIQLRFGDHWTPRYGAPGGHAQEFLLQEGEHVTAVDGSSRACIWHLRWTTSRGRQASFGSAAGMRFSAHPPSPGQQLLTVNGQHWFFCLSGIGFKWGFAPQKMSSQALTVAPQEPTAGLRKVSGMGLPFPLGFPFQMPRHA